MFIIYTTKPLYEVKQIEPSQENGNSSAFRPCWKTISIKKKWQHRNNAGDIQNPFEKVDPFHYVTNSLLNNKVNILSISKK